MILFPGRHEAFFKSKCVHTIREPSRGQDVTFLKGELMKIEESFKVSRDDSDETAKFYISSLSLVFRHRQLYLIHEGQSSPCPAMDR
jgi:uncharacterized SAM-dependent methyltransferase